MPLVVVWVNRWTFSSPPSPSPSPSHHQICQRPLTKTWFQRPLTIVLCTVLYCTVLYCTVLYCIVLYCTVLYCKKKQKKNTPTPKKIKKITPPQKKIQNKGGLNCTVDHGSCAADALLFFNLLSTLTNQWNRHKIKKQKQKQTRPNVCILIPNYFFVVEIFNTHKPNSKRPPKFPKTILK